MPTAIENAQFLDTLFRPLSDSIGAINGREVKPEQIKAQERLRIIKQAQDEQEREKAFGYHKALVQLQTDSAERISDKQTTRMIDAQDAATKRALAIQASIEARADAKAVRDQLAKAKADYRILAGAKAKSLSEFGDTPEQQLDGLNTELAVLNDNRSRATAKIALKAQREYGDELSRITTITPADEPTLVSMAMGSISDKDTLEKLKKLKPKTGDDIAAALTILNPQAAMEFAGAYQSAKEAVVGNRAKTSKIASLEKNLQSHTVLLQKDPKAAEYVALGLDEDSTPAQTTSAPAVRSLDNIFGTQNPAANTAEGMLRSGAPSSLSTRSGLGVPIEAATPAQATLSPNYGGVLGGFNFLKRQIPNAYDTVSLAGNMAASPFARGLNYLAGGDARVAEGDDQRKQAVLEILKRYQQRNVTPAFIPAQ